MKKSIHTDAKQNGKGRNNTYVIQKKYMI